MKRITAKQYKVAAGKRLKQEYGLNMHWPITFMAIARIIREKRTGNAHVENRKFGKAYVKKYALEFMESMKPVEMDQVQKDWYKSEFFLKSKEWLELRYKIITKYGAKCQCCGRDRNDGAIIQIDHIKPRSIYPELATDESNLQCCCRECNLGKSYKFTTDWRTTEEKRR
jgi:hypothetical protein